MTTRVGAAESPFRLDDAARARLSARLARGGGLASVSVPLPASLDLSAAVLAARRPDDRYFCFEQPDRDGFALAGVGAAAVVEARGSQRFASAAAQCREIAHALEFSDPGPVWVGGFAFSPDGGMTPEWSSLAAGQLVLPEVLLRRERGEAWMVVTASSVEAAERRIAELQPASMPLLDPDPVTAARVASAAPREHFESAIERAVERISRGDLRKVVLAREVRVHSPVEISPGAVFDGLRLGFPSCYCYLVGSPELAFVGASPELLARRDGQRVQTVALAGTRRRSADPAVDSHLGEQLLQSPKDREEQPKAPHKIKCPIT